MTEVKKEVGAVMDSRRRKIMMSQYRAFHERKSPHQIAFPDPQNMNIWNVLICGMDGPHEFGEYFIRFEAGPDFPHRAPKSFQCLTENGVYEMGGPICIS